LFCFVGLFVCFVLKNENEFAVIRKILNPKTNIPNFVLHIKFKSENQYCFLTNQIKIK